MRRPQAWRAGRCIIVLRKSALPPLRGRELEGSLSGLDAAEELAGSTFSPLSLPLLRLFPLPEGRGVQLSAA
jgi:hypothetical protein